MVPPLAVATAVPSLAPLHVISIDPVLIASAVGVVIFTVAVWVQLLPSVTVIVWFPAARLTAFCPASPLLQEQLYGIVPPAAVAAAVPSMAPLQVISVIPVFTARTVGSAILSEAVWVQPFKSVTVTDTGPSPRPLTCWVVAPLLQL